jgi:glycosyltransferase involved in cell wall biosynthesis
MRWSARRCDLLFTVSEYSRAEIARRYGLPVESISVLHNAVDPTVFFPGRSGEHLVNAHGLKSGGYLLTVGRIEPRKNHAALLRAYRALHGDVPPLVIAGQRDFGYGDFEAELAQMPVGHRVVVLSNVGDAELPALYRHALAFVYPSFAEGFGMPPLEAMASGIPVVSSNSTAIPEVIGDAGLLIDPSSVDQLRTALTRILTDVPLRSQLIGRGLAQAKRFTWKRSAEQLAASYRAYFERVGSA